MKSNAIRFSGLIGALSFAAVVGTAPAWAAYENAPGARHHVTHHRHHYVYRSEPAGVVEGVGVAAGKAAAGVVNAGVTVWDALDCATFGYYCRR